MVTAEQQHPVLSRIRKVEGPMDTPCWEWQGCKNEKGYGQVTYHGKRWIAHRLFYYLLTGTHPMAMFCCHHCDNPACCNPGHIFLGNNQDNMRDCSRKGRVVIPGYKGEDHALAVLSEDQIRTMAAQYVAGTTKTELASQYNTAVTNVCMVLNGHTWGHVKLEFHGTPVKDIDLNHKIPLIKSWLSRNVLVKEIAKTLNKSENSILMIEALLDGRYKPGPSEFCHWRSSLSGVDCIHIRSLYKNGFSSAEIASLFMIHKSQVARIVSGKRRKL